MKRRDNGIRFWSWDLSLSFTALGELTQHFFHGKNRTKNIPGKCEIHLFVHNDLRNNCYSRQFLIQCSFVSPIFDITKLNPTVLAAEEPKQAVSIFTLYWLSSHGSCTVLGWWAQHPPPFCCTGPHPLAQRGDMGPTPCCGGGWALTVTISSSMLDQLLQILLAGSFLKLLWGVGLK